VSGMKICMQVLELPITQGASLRCLPGFGTLAHSPGPLRAGPSVAAMSNL